MRELKNRLAEYIREVRAGGAVAVTDRGTVVAEIVPPGEIAARAGLAGLEALAAKGEVRLGKPNDPAAYPTMPRFLRTRHAADLLDEERGER